jgi:hypothetical protein
MEDRSISFGGGQVGSILNQRFKTPYHNSYKNCDHNNHINSLKQGCFLDNWRHFLCDSVFYVTLQFQKIKTHDTFQNSNQVYYQSFIIALFESIIGITMILIIFIILFFF